MKKILFIGGRSDGQWKGDPGLPKLVMIYLGPRGTHERQVYRREKISFREGDYEVYIRDSLTNFDAFGMLLQNYKQCEFPVANPPLQSTANLLASDADEFK